MNKKIIQCFLFSLILFGCFFFVNSCSAVQPEEIITHIKDSYANGYYGTNLEPVDNKTKEITKELTYYPYSEELQQIYYKKLNSYRSDFNSYDSYLCFSNYFSSTSYTFNVYLYNSSDVPNGFCITKDGEHRFTLISNGFQYASVIFNGVTHELSYNTINPTGIATNSGHGWYDNVITDAILFSNNRINYVEDTDLNGLYIAYEPEIINTDTTIENKNSNIQITYSYSEDRSKCHVDATIVNGAFSDKLYYSYQMPSISGQGLVLGKTQFPIERFRYNFELFDFLSS